MNGRSNHARFICSVGTLFVLSLVPAAWAQVVPMSVNDCTLLPDPGALRRCLDQAEGRVVTTPPPLSSGTGLSQPSQETQATRPPAGPRHPPATTQEESNFLARKTSRPIETTPAKKNVIDLN